MRSNVRSRVLIPFYCGVGFVVAAALPMLWYFYGSRSSTARTVMFAEALVVLFVASIAVWAIARLPINWSVKSTESGLVASCIMLGIATVVAVAVVAKLAHTYPNFHLETLVWGFGLGGLVGVFFSNQIVERLHRGYHDYLVSMREAETNGNSLWVHSFNTTGTSTHRTVQGGAPSRP